MPAANSKQGRYAERRARARRPASMEFPEDLYEQLQAQAAIEEKSMAALTRRGVRRAAWWFKEAGYVDSDTLDDEIAYEAANWWKGHEKGKMWSRSGDFAAGMRAASRHLIRSHARITKVRRPLAARVRVVRSQGEVADSRDAYHWAGTERVAQGLVKP